MSSYREYDKETLDKLHKVELSILDDFVKVCEKNNLTYFLIGGSLLGAVRHSGFIPWDDDIDIGMPRKDYDKFIEIGQEELGDKYFVDCFERNKDFYLPFVKIKLNGTVFDEEVAKNYPHHKGIFIDIFAFENVKNTKKIGKVRAFMIKTIAESTHFRLHMRPLKNLHHPFFGLCCCLVPWRTMMRFQKKLMTWNKNDNSMYVNPLSGSYAYEKETNLRSTVLPVKKIKFEGKMYNGMTDNDTYLKKIYGDNYMELPPLEKRINHLPDTIIFPEEIENESKSKKRKNK